MRKEDIGPTTKAKGALRLLTDHGSVRRNKVVAVV
jgi:hypothetical protein